MSYEYKTIKNTMKMIGNNDMYLPAIQRKFVWKPEQIESLFDSIMRNYPIGTFLFWYVDGENKKRYTFYKFLSSYHEEKHCFNEIAPSAELKEQIIGVLDGQQRLSAMYIALQGTYAYKKLHVRRSNMDAYPIRKFYLNLLSDRDEGESEDFKYEFKFLTESDATQADEKHLWFLVREVLSWEEEPDIDTCYDDLLELKNISASVKEIIRIKRKQIKMNLRILHQKLVLKELISSYKIEEQELDPILDIFVRVNSAGTVLKKSDLLFSTIIAHWESGRDQIEKFIEYINEKGDGFSFDNDFIMRSCLVLTDSPVLFKVGTFQKENIKKIKKMWPYIKKALDKTVDVLVEFGFSKETLTSQYAVMPIAYYFVKKGNGSSAAKIELRKYLINSLVKQVYGRQGDQVLAKIREAMREEKQGEYELKEKVFSFDQLLGAAKLTGKNSLKITEEDIEAILEEKKGPYTFMALSLLYPGLKFAQVKFHQDHIHPASQFSGKAFKGLKLSEDKQKAWEEMKDTLPNLQLMEGPENQGKNKKPFRDWLYGEDASGLSNVPDVEKFKIDNYIPSDIELEFNDFEKFYMARKNLLKDKISKILLCKELSNGESDRNSN